MDARLFKVAATRRDSYALSRVHHPTMTMMAMTTTTLIIGIVYIFR